MADPKLDQYGFPIPEDALDRLETQGSRWPNDAEPPPADKKGRGCLFYGCLFTAIGLLLLIVAAVAAVYFGLRQVRDNFTAAEPAEIPVVELPEEELQQLEERFEEFRRAVEPGDGAVEGDADADEPAEPAEPAPQELSLSAEEINALIATQRELRGRVFLRIEDGRIGGDLSIPLEGIPVVGDRFFNARADFEVELEGGELIVRLADAEVNGVPVPDEVLDQLANQNLAEDAADDPDARRFLQRVESLRVEGDRLILRLRDPNEPAETEPAESPPAEIEVFEEPAPTE